MTKQLKHLKHLKMVLSIAILIVTTCTQLAYASRSQLENGYLVVPRIDFDGYGALELTFRLDFDNEWVLILEQATEASLSISNSGVFDPVQFTIDVNEIELDTGALYAVQLKLISQTDYFVFSIAESVHLNPLPAFDHSAEALPPSGWPPADYILNTMPQGSSSSCDASCASLFAEYILGASNKSNQQVTSQAEARGPLGASSCPIDPDPVCSPRLC